MEQKKMCCFIHSNQCKNKNHNGCQEVWRTLGAEATCDCYCHKNNTVSGELNHSTVMEDSGLGCESNNEYHNSRT